MKYFQKPSLRLLIALSLVAAASAVAQATEPNFPPGLRVGIVPLEGLKPATEFAGFEAPDKTLKVGVLEIPEAAFASFDAAFKEGKAIGTGQKPEVFETAAGKSYLAIETGKDGDVTVKSFSLMVPGNKYTGYVIAQVRESTANPYSDEAIRRMLATTATRNEVPVAEQLAQLPFKVDELSGFKTVRSLGQQTAVLLTDGDEDATLDSTPYMVIGVIQAKADAMEDRARFAQQISSTIPGLRESRIISNEPMRIDGMPGFETRINAVSGKDDTPVSVVQWLRFSGGATIRIIASCKRDDWPASFPRFRAVRDGIQPK